jgi:hypothetical protein
MTRIFDAEAHADHMAKVMTLDIREEWRQSVVDNLKATEALAQLVLSFALDEHVEPAPVFEA